MQIDESYVRMELTDGRILSIPLHWIPTVYDAAPEDREKFRVNSSQNIIVWDPEEGPINEELRVQDYGSSGSQGVDMFGSG